MKTGFQLLAAFLLLLPGCTIHAQGLENRFQHILDSIYQANPSSVGIMIHVESPDKHVSWTSAAGISDKTGGQRLLKDQPALIASNTKTYVAVAILRLIEMGKVGLDQPIEAIISKASRKRFSKRGYKLREITIKHLLSHTSGIGDYVNDDYFDFVNKNPDHQWSREEQVELAAKVGLQVGEPGEKYKYADIEYLLLTEIIEKYSQKPFYTAIRELIDYESNTLNSTWFRTLEKEPRQIAPMAHQYWAKYDWDSYALNPSWDLFGGGGLAATTKDLALFYQKLFEGKIIRDPAILKLLYADIVLKEKTNYCLGVMKLNFHGYKAYYHGGFWGTDAMYLPDLNTTISVFTLQKEQRDLNAALSKAIIQVLVDSK